jgi:hypothetical protein
LKAGDPCPDGQCDGKVYPQRDPGVLVRIKGQAPIAATVYELVVGQFEFPFCSNGPIRQNPVTAHPHRCSIPIDEYRPSC